MWVLPSSGPSFAREIAMNQATAVVIASDDSCLANDMAKVPLSQALVELYDRRRFGLELQYLPSVSC